MKGFVESFAKDITGSLSCFDRVIFKGHLKAINYPEGMEKFIARRGLKIKDFGNFVKTQSDRLVLHAKTCAAKYHRPYRYLDHHIRKDEEARHIAQELKISRGLVCVFSELETCPTFKIAYAVGRPKIVATRRKCLCLFYYFLHPELGLIHVRIQSWFPMVVQVAVNGHDWLAVQMRRRRMKFEQLDNAFLSIDKPGKAQKLADQFAHLDWPPLLQKLATFVNPLLSDFLAGHSCYWTTDQAEFATDIMFRNRQVFSPLYEQLFKHAFLCFGASDVLGFLGKKLTPNFSSDVLTDIKTRPEGKRIKHRIAKNWIKMYDKFGAVLRVETVINYPYVFLTRRHGHRKGKSVIGWFPMTKGVTGLPRYAEIARLANSRYLEALSVVRDPRPAQELLCRCTRRHTLHHRTYRGFNPAAQEDIAIFQAFSAGQHCLHGLRNTHIRSALYPNAKPDEQRKLSARASRILKRLHVRGLIAKIPHSRRWRVTPKGHAFMSMAIRYHAEFYPAALAA